MGQISVELIDSSQSMIDHGTKKNGSAFSSARYQMEVKSTCCSSIGGSDVSEVSRWLFMGNQRVTKDLLSIKICLDGKHWMQKPWQPSVDDLGAITPNHSLIANRNFFLTYLLLVEDFVDHRILFRKTQAYSHLISKIFRKKICQLWTIGKNGNVNPTEICIRLIAFGWSKTTTNEGFSNLVALQKQTQVLTEQFDQQQF